MDYSLIFRRHPFIDDSKRVAVTATGIFLEINGHRFTASNAEVTHLAVKMAAEEAEVAQTARQEPSANTLLTL